MRTTSRVLALFAASLFAHPAGASPFSATLSFERTGFAPMSFVGAGSGISSPASVTVPSGLFAGTATGGPDFAVVVASQEAGAFTGTPLAGAMPIHGTLNDYVDVPLVGTGGGVGIGGTAMGTSGTVVFTAEFRPFAVGMQTQMLVGSYHFPSGMHISYVSTYSYTLVVTGTDSRTPGGLGQITLVSPIVVRLVGPPACLSCYAPVVTAVLTVSFVPEPGTFALLGVGTLGLAAWGRRRTLRRRGL